MTVTRSTLRGLGDPVRTPCEAALDVARAALLRLHVRAAAFPDQPVYLAASDCGVKEALDQSAKIYPEAIR